MTARAWDGRKTWRHARRAHGVWADVRIYDATDLELWMERVPSAHVRISEMLGPEPRDARTPDAWWQTWPAQTDPALPLGFLLAGREEARAALADELTKPPQVITAIASSKTEALAFLCASLVNGGEQFDGLRAKALVVTGPGSWGRLVDSDSPLVLMPTFEEADVATALSRGHRVVVPVSRDVRPRGALVAIRPLDRQRAAEEHLVAALRCLYQRAVDDGLIAKADNPARKVAKPRRLPSTRRAVPDTRLAEINETAAATGDDPELDTLLLRLHTETACRRGGALALRPQDLDPDQCLVLLREKGETVRWQPVSPTLMGRLVEHGRERHAPPDGQLLRYRSGQPITSRRYDHLWTRLGRHLPWVRTQQISMHWIRHTTLTWVERNFGYAVARAYAGHTDSGSETGATATYVRASLAEVAAALAALTGEPHPLATTEGWCPAWLPALSTPPALRTPACVAGPGQDHGPAVADRSPAAIRPDRAVRFWPLLVLAAPAAAEVWSGWSASRRRPGSAWSPRCRASGPRFTWTPPSPSRSRPTRRTRCAPGWPATR